jgi:hypothetical protein
MTGTRESSQGHSSDDQVVKEVFEKIAVTFFHAGLVVFTWIHSFGLWAANGRNT